MTLFLTDPDVRSVFDWTLAIAALRRAYATPDDLGRYPPRTMARGDGVWLRTLSGVAAQGGWMGAKLIAASTRHARASYLIPLFDQESVALVALLDGHSITGFRTAATSALAADCLAPTGALDLAVIGTGFEARNHLRALASVRPLKRVRVYSPNPASRTRFVDEMADLGLSIEAATSAEDATDGAGLIVCAARSRDERPTVMADCVSPGATLVSIGSTLPEQREIDAALIGRSTLIVADQCREVAHETGDLLAATASGIAFEHKFVSLADVVSGRRRGRNSPDELVIYKSVGAAIQDLAVATMCVARARELGIGTALPVSIAPVEKGK